MSGCAAKCSADLLIRQAMADDLSAEKNPVAERQFLLWRRLLTCEGYGLDQLALYFLRARGNFVETFLPLTLAAEAGAEELYASARIIEILGYQLTKHEKQTLLEMLYLRAERAADSCLLRDRSDEDAAALCSLFLALHTSFHDGNGDFWDYEIYRSHAKRLQRSGKAG